MIFLNPKVLKIWDILMKMSKRKLRDEAWSLLQIGLGGYVVGRSGEK